ncbi:hypothetical protein PanWU01x14_280420 [Parasponia andersonii]|uniref:Uncharacterized protein n=1 Tax=Parasponia andersonii TaxID=3476 RepID=A0A2P5B1G1_PARAD|nr:hypothetical protein PanWU01x14_280420 [Parasponia andersonii]
MAVAEWETLEVDRKSIAEKVILILAVTPSDLNEISSLAREKIRRLENYFPVFSKEDMYRALLVSNMDEYEAFKVLKWQQGVNSWFHSDKKTEECKNDVNGLNGVGCCSNAGGCSKTECSTDTYHYGPVYPEPHGRMWYSNFNEKKNRLAEALDSVREPLLGKERLKHMTRQAMLDFLDVEGPQEEGTEPEAQEGGPEPEAQQGGPALEAQQPEPEAPK